MNNYTATEQAYKNGYANGYENGRREKGDFACHMCDNAKINEELEKFNDYSSCTIGSFDKECRIMLTSGMGKPLRIEIDRWNEKSKRWETVGMYHPRYCPECGREILEYK